MAHLSIVFHEPSLQRLKERMTIRDYVFWREAYTKVYGLECNGFKLRWEKLLSVSEKAEALIVGLGGVISQEEFEQLKRYEHGQTE